MDDLKEAIVEEVDDETQAMSVEEAKQHLESLKNWELLYDESKGYHLQRCFNFTDADKSREFVNELKPMCDEMHPIPVVQVNGMEVEIVCYTPQLSGLHFNDFIMAAHADELYMRWDEMMADQDKVSQASYESFPASDPPGY